MPKPLSMEAQQEEFERAQRAEALSEDIAQAAADAEGALEDLAELLLRVPDARSRWPMLLPQLQGESRGWLGDGFAIDEIRRLSQEGVLP